MQGQTSMRNFKLMAMSASCVAVAVAGLATPAFAQSTGSVEFEKDIVVTGAKSTTPINGIVIPQTPKAKEVLDQSFISTAQPGQSINDTINMIPGVASFNADPFGSSGGKLYIRGFDNSRISETFDGMPLNDTGNYALYSNQMLDPELIDNVNVNLGTTDVDSPTASATGSTINYRSLTPTEDFHAMMVGSVGEYNFQRIFGMIQTGNLTKGGLRGWLSASSATNDLFSGGIGKVDKKQFNFKLYQPLGDNGDFISIAGHWNRNRNNNSPSIYLITQGFGNAPVNSSRTGRYPTKWSEAFYNIGTCSVAPGVNGQRDAASSCGTAWEYGYNPSDTGNLRANMRFTLSDKLLLTIDPSVQYVKANGGLPAVNGLEQTCTAASCGGATTGYIGGSYYIGRDLNGDGDTLDTVSLRAPSHTQTWRLGVNASLRYKIDEHNTLRIAYTYDRGRHHQTGELGYARQDGFGVTPFPVDTPITDASGNIIEKRNRLSYAILHQVSGEYSGRFLDNRLDVAIGLRAPFLRRDLNNNCFTTTAGGFVDCLGNAGLNAAYATAHPTYAAPQQRVIDYNRVLPQAGFTFKFTPQLSMFANYSKGMQVPGTDNLYNAFYFAANSASAHPTPETTDNYDAGLRFNSRKVAVQLSGWYTLFQNRLAQAYDQDTQTTIYRNLGKVEKYGFDGSVNYQPIKELSFYAFASLMKSRIVANVDAGTCASQAAAAISTGSVACSGTEAYYQTAGKRESGAPVSTLGARVEGHVSLFDVIVQAKRTGSRYINDQNLPVFSGTTKVDNAAVGAYTTVDLSLRADLNKVGAPKGTFLQLNVVNLFNKFYVGGFDGSTAAYYSSNPSTTAYLPIPRTFTGSISVAF
ncbi:MAG: TonB-dependent receptor [Sphingomonadales bacterium]|nr:TonB-dependent receptor [Sphingomonadales bacterium]MDE2169641.1 TonB-dependent receptor [Sphingomonadales bacterium]